MRIVLNAYQLYTRAVVSLLSANALRCEHITSEQLLYTEEHKLTVNIGATCCDLSLLQEDG